MTADQVLGILTIIVGVLAPAVGYLFKQQRDARRKLFERYDSIRADFTAFQIEAAKQYMSKGEIKELIEAAIKPVKESLQRIERSQDKLLNGRK